MRLLYLCLVDPPPPDSDYSYVLDFFDTVPEYLQPRSKRYNTDNLLFFADRFGGDLLPEFYDAVIIFLSERFMKNEKAFSCMKQLSDSFDNIIGVDLYDNLPSAMKLLARSYTKRILSFADAKIYLETNYPDPNIISEQEAEALNKVIETDGYDFLNDTIKQLNDKEENNKRLAYICYIGSFLVLAGISVLVILKGNLFSLVDDCDINIIIYSYSKVVLISVLAIALARFLFLLGKSFMVEAIRCSDRSHAIGLGKLYLTLYKNKFSWNELKEVLQNWNIDQGSAFRNLDAKDIDIGAINSILQGIKKR